MQPGRAVPSVFWDLERKREARGSSRRASRVDRKNRCYAGQRLPVRFGFSGATAARILFSIQQGRARCGRGTWPSQGPVLLSLEWDTIPTKRPSPSTTGLPDVPPWIRASNSAQIAPPSGSSGQPYRVTAPVVHPPRCRKTWISFGPSGARQAVSASPALRPRVVWAVGTGAGGFRSLLDRLPIARPRADGSVWLVGGGVVVVPRPAEPRRCCRHR
jgi:hypothetical protein